MTLRLITAATNMPLTLAQVKLHCKVDVSDDDDWLQDAIVTATEAAEQEMGRSVMPQTWELTLDSFPSAFELTRVPAASVTSLKYYDVDGVQQTLQNTLYALDNTDDFGPAYIVPRYGTSWPSTNGQINAVACRFVSGYASADQVPQPIKSWIKVHVAQQYKYRERTIVERATLIDMTYVDRLLDRYRIWKL